MISLENQEPMSKGRKAAFIVIGVVCVLLLWIFAAAVKRSTMTYANGDFAPDKVVTVSPAKFAAEELGFASGASVPLSKQFADEHTGKLELTLSKVYRDGDGRNVVVLGSRLGTAYGYTSYPESTKVKWATGNVPSVTFTFSANTSVHVLYAGEGYDLWRFLTFRGSESYSYVVQNNATYIRSATLSEILSHATSVTITLPNTPEWQRVKTAQ